MKKLNLLIILLISITTLQAQESIGFRSGLNFNGESNSTMFSNTFTTGFSIAIPLRFQLSKRFAFQPEFAFIEKGNGGTFPKDIDVTIMIGNTTITPNADYTYRSIVNTLEIPLLFNYTLKQSNKVNIGLLFGPSIGYGISVNYKDNIIGKRTVNIKSENFKERVDYNVILGTDILFKIGKHQFVGDIRYNYEVTGWIEELFYNTTFHGLNISFGYIYPLK